MLSVIAPCRATIVPSAICTLSVVFGFPIMVTSVVFPTSTVDVSGVKCSSKTGVTVTSKAPLSLPSAESMLTLVVPIFLAKRLILLSVIAPCRATTASSAICTLSVVFRVPTMVTSAVFPSSKERASGVKDNLNIGVTITSNLPLSLPSAVRICT